ncbi:MAG TPA: glycolate oxidase iron-sulfur subunit [Porticoccaceae bacterium]|nr:glycolate oxidase iron-sulfur subunit [Porticoccaceae bacterium]
MQTHFTPEQRSRPSIQVADEVLRKCVHCGFCTATCPTFRLTGDELESPRGRITLIQNLLESEATPTAETVANLDHCLSCLACESTCPSGVSYRRLIDQGRELVEDKYRRPLADRLTRSLLAWLLPRPTWFRRALKTGAIGKPLLRVIGKFLPQANAMANMMPAQLPDTSDAVKPGFHAAQGEELMHVALVTGCVQNVLGPQIDAAAIRVLPRHGCSVTVPEPSTTGCCGALPHHLGKAAQARMMARENMTVWRKLLENGNQTRPIDSFLMTASGCASMLKDYPHLLSEEKNIGGIDIRINDISVILNELFTKESPVIATKRSLPETMAWQAPCSLQHGMQEKIAPLSVLRACGFDVREPRDAYLCCGSAGTYNLLQPEFADQLGEDKRDKLRATGADIVVSANIGCISQLNSGDASGTSLRVIHLAEAVDWATGGPKPASLR